MSKKLGIDEMIIGYIGYLFAYRYASFGYLPADSYKFVVAILFFIGLIVLFQRLILKL